MALVTAGVPAKMQDMKVLHLLPILLLGACATGPSRSDVLNSMIGLPETEVVRQLGVPSRTYETGGHTFLAYIEQRAQVLDPVPAFYGSGFYGSGFYGAGFGPGFGLGAAFPTEIIPRTCETTIDVVGGRMVTWSLRGNACG